MKLLLPLLAACEPGTPPGPATATSEGGQSGSDPGGSSYECEEIRSPAGPEEAVEGPWGIVRASDLRALAGGLFAGELLWEDGSATPVEVELSWDGPVWAVTSDESWCPPALELEGQTRLTTEDGRLDERQSSVLWAYHPENATFLLRWEAPLTGTLPLAEGEALDSRVEVDELGLTGLIMRVSGGGSPGIGSATAGTLASFTAERTEP